MARSMTLMGVVEDLEEEGLAEGAGDEAVEVPGEVRDAEDEVTDGEDTLDEAGDDIETLEEVKEILDDAADNGEGLDETAAKIVEATVEKIYARLGIQSSSVVGSIESFKNPRSRVTATRMAAEDIGDKVSRAWEAVKKFFKDLWEKIKGLWKKYVTAVGRLKARAMATRTKLGKVGSSKKEETIESKEYAQAFTDKSGKLTLGEQLDHTLEAIKVQDTVRDAMIDILDSIDKASDEGAKKAAADKLKGVLKGLHHVSSSEGKGILRNVADKDILVGNRTIAFYFDESKDNFTFDIFEAEVDEGDRKDDDTIDVADKATLVGYCSKIMQVCDTIDHDKEKVAKADKRILAKLDKMGKTKKGDDQGKKDDAKEARIAREILRANGKFSYLPEKIAISGCHKALSYVNRCASMYEK